MKVNIKDLGAKKYYQFMIIDKLSRKLAIKSLQCKNYQYDGKTAQQMSKHGFHVMV